ncbi:hypothetical protein CBS101457_002518 [Exobasidium rhododendri]|nr:hypothetical protein CBS101457_002518 [Exobasidium rhododendri]
MHLSRLAIPFAAMAGIASAQVAMESGMTADSHCGDGYCFTALYVPSSKALNYTLVVPQGGEQLGWYSVAQGTQMVGANMAVNWVNSDMSTTTSHRGTTKEVQPLESEVTTSAGFVVNQGVSVSKTNLTVWSWNFPQQDAPTNAMSHVFAMSSTSPSTSDSSATIYKHDRYDTEITLDLTKAYTGAAPAGLTSLSSVSSVSPSPTTAALRDLHSNITRIYLVHMIFMVVGWMLIAPLGILIARYGRTLFKWFPAHRGLQLFATLLIFIAFFLAIAAVGMTGGAHFAYTHNKVGLALFILLFVQIALGVGSHAYRGKTGKRYIGYAHAPLGLVLFGLSVWQIHLGFAIWKWEPPMYASYIIYGWAGLMFLLYIVGFVFLPKELRQDRATSETKSNLSDEQLTAEINRSP